ncbi:hypothetical protein [Changchengzhania lutea]|uniref:hypothetical protein n=1 Tax=Changchengzhania lutea TaxID=2049305 RepID=UPI00115EFAF7|nr:hypothetical protein [Changchengzhania lutea]
MKKMKYILSSTILTLFLFGCDVQEAKQDSSPIGSTEGYSIPSFTLTSEGSTNEGDETVYTYTVTLDKPITKNVNLAFEILDGTTATEHEDFDFVSGTLRAYETTTTLQIIIYNDDEVEDTEILNVTVVPGPDLETAYILNPISVYPELSITIDNFTSGDLNIGMEWDADNGSGASPTELADLILLITDAVSPYTTVIGSADGGSFETYTMTSDTPDGDYFVIADVYALDDSDFDMDITVTFDQGGVVQGAAIEFPAAMNSRILCDEYVVLAKVTKSGETYSWTSENATLTNEPANDSAAPYIGTSTVLLDAWADYANGASVEIEAGTSANEFWIRNYTNPAITNTDTAYLIVTIDDVCGNVTVMSNEDYDYGCPTGVVTGSGTVDLNSKTIDITNTFALGAACGGDYPGQRFVLRLP